MPHLLFTSVRRLSLSSSSSWLLFWPTVSKWRTSQKFSANTKSYSPTGHPSQLLISSLLKKYARLTMSKSLSFIRTTWGQISASMIQRRTIWVQWYYARNETGSSSQKLVSLRAIIVSVLAAKCIVQKSLIKRMQQSAIQKTRSLIVRSYTSNSSLMTILNLKWSMKQHRVLLMYLSWISCERLKFTRSSKVIDSSLLGLV